MSPLLLLAHAAATLMMTGLIVFVQVVHYPLFDRVGRDGFARYAADHSSLTTLVVGPLMLLEAGTALALALRPPPGVPAAWCWLGLALVLVIWLATAFLSVPQHGVLAGGFDARAHATLVATNWVRTLAWAVRSALVLAMLQRMLRAA